MLRLYLRNRDDLPTYGKLLRRSLPIIVGMVLISVVVGTLWTLMSGRAGFYLVSGILMGMVISFLSELVDRIRRWRLLAQVIDWQKVEELVKEYPHAK